MYCGFEPPIVAFVQPIDQLNNPSFGIVTFSQLKVLAPELFETFPTPVPVPVIEEFEAKTDQLDPPVRFVYKEQLRITSSPEAFTIKVKLTVLDLLTARSGGPMGVTIIA